MTEQILQIGDVITAKFPSQNPSGRELAMSSQQNFLAKILAVENKKTTDPQLS